MKRIGIILSHFPSVTETFILREIKELERKGFEIVLLVVKKGKISKIHSDAKPFLKSIFYRPNIFSKKMVLAQIHFLVSYPIRYLKTLFFILEKNFCDMPVLLKTLLNFPCALYFARVMKDKDIDHIHAHFATIPTSLAIIIANILDIHFSFTAHARDIYVNRTMLLEKLRLAKFVITCSEYNRKCLETLTTENLSKKIFTIYHGLDIEKFSKTRFCLKYRNLNVLRRSSHDLQILSVGRLVEKKGFSYLIEACNFVKKKFNFRCIVVGEGKEKKRLKKMINSYKLNNSIFLIGELTQEELISLYAQADIFVLPCIIGKDGDHDGLPNVLVEALAMKIATVSTNISAISELIEDGETGLLVPEKDAEALALAIEKLLKNNILRRNLGDKGRNKIVKLFNIKKNVDLIAKLIDRN